VAWARDHGTLVIEDDYDGEFRYDRQPAGALQGLDPERVVYAGTASKTLTPALRLGWLVLPDRLLEPVLAAKLNSTPALEQLALAELLAGGGYDRHVRRMRQRYRRRRDSLLARLGDRRTLGIAAGLHVVVEVDSEAEVLAHAANHDLALESLRRYWHRDARFQGLVIGYAAPPEHAFAAALDTLSHVLGIT
jgi:GntR family transcriptional regulator/MocR family aminotransferase